MQHTSQERYRDIYDRWKNTLHGFELSPGGIIRLFVPPPSSRLMAIVARLQHNVCEHVCAVDGTVCVTLNGYEFAEKIVGIALTMLRAERCTNPTMCQPQLAGYYTSNNLNIPNELMYVELCTALRPQYPLVYTTASATVNFSVENSERVASPTADMLRPFTNTRLYATRELLAKARELLGPSVVFVDAPLRPSLVAGMFECRVCLLQVAERGALCAECVARNF